MGFDGVCGGRHERADRSGDALAFEDPTFLYVVVGRCRSYPTCLCMVLYKGRNWSERTCSHVSAVVVVKWGGKYGEDVERDRDCFKAKRNESPVR
jgi:hypothetical protein